MLNKMRLARVGVLFGVMLAPAGLLQAQSSEPGSMPEQNAPGQAAVAVQPKPVGPARISGGVMAGQIVTKVTPAYPVKARAKGIGGTVVLHAIIGRGGAIERLTVVSGPDLLQAAALDAVRQWVYKPYLLNGEPTEVDTTIMVNFSMGSGPAAPDHLQSTQEAPGDGIQPQRMIRVSGGVLAGNVLTKVDPRYPEQARQAGVGGTVVLLIMVSKDGVPTHLELVSGPPVLGDAAIDAVRQWRYRPYLLNGEPVEVQSTVSLMFTPG